MNWKKAGDVGASILTAGLWWVAKKVAGKIAEKAAPKAITRLVKKFDKTGVVPKEIVSVAKKLGAGDGKAKLDKALAEAEKIIKASDLAKRMPPIFIPPRGKK